MRRFLPPRSGLRRASPAPSLGRKKQPREAHSAGSRIGPGRLQQTARRVARQHRGAHQSRPRPCGERVADSMVTLLAYGSPPHMRGMPARTAFFCSSIGSPPHTRGKECRDCRRQHQSRITPAYAGKKHPASGRMPVAAEYPAHAGNCPVLRNPGRNAAPRITPARAGKRQPSHVYSHPFWEHPCLCREKICYEAPEDEKNGSPSPMRGKELRRLRDVLELRITPAHAGKRRRTAPLPSGTPDHPACAGKRHFRYRAICRCQDHPRLCGEKTGSKSPRSAVIGSPPPVRGKVLYGEGGAATMWITPACAGKRE